MLRQRHAWFETVTTSCALPVRGHRLRLASRVIKDSYRLEMLLVKITHGENLWERDGNALLGLAPPNGNARSITEPGYGQPQGTSSCKWIWSWSSLFLGVVVFVVVVPISLYDLSGRPGTELRWTGVIFTPICLILLCRHTQWLAIGTHSPTTCYWLVHSPSLSYWLLTGLILISANTMCKTSAKVETVWQSQTKLRPNLPESCSFSENSASEITVSFSSWTFLIVLVVCWFGTRDSCICIHYQLLRGILDTDETLSKSAIKPRGLRQS